MNARQTLVTFTLKYNGDWNKIYEAIRTKELISDEDYEKYGEIAKGYQFITAIDEEYPKALKNIYKPPFVLFYKGDLSLLNNNVLGAFGSRETPVSDRKFYDKIDEHNHTLLSCNDYALDTTKNKTINVLYGGFDIRHHKADLEITEYPNGVNPTQDTMAYSKRIMAGLCNKLVIVNGCLHSANTLLVNQALTMNKDIFIIPHPFEEENLTTQFIVNGATPLVSIEQLD